MTARRLQATIPVPQALDIDPDIPWRGCGSGRLLEAVHKLALPVN